MGREVAILFRYIFLAGKTRYSCDGALSIYQFLSSPKLTGLHCKMRVYVCLSVCVRVAIYKCTVWINLSYKEIGDIHCL